MVERNPSGLRSADRIDEYNQRNRVQYTNVPLSNRTYNPSGLRSADRIDEYNQRTGFRGVDPRTGQQIYGAPYGAYAGRQQGTPPNTPPETPPETPKPLYNASDSRAILRGLLSNYGFDPADIESALGTVVGYLDTYDPDIIAEALLPQTELYKRRFSGNQERIKKGMAALSPAEYLAMETSYRQVLDAYKLPAGFYDDPKTDFAYWIANDVSAVEIEARAKTAFEWSNSVDPELKKALKQYYGVGDSEIAAYALDRQRASGIIEKQFRATQIGAEAIRQNIDIGRQFSEQLVDTGVSQQQAREAFDFTAQTKDAFSKLATIEGTDLNTGEIIESQLGMSAEATKKIRGLASQERARFSGQSGSAQTLRQNVSGQY